MNVFAVHTFIINYHKIFPINIIYMNVFLASQPPSTWTGISWIHFLANSNQKVQVNPEDTLLLPWPRSCGHFLPGTRMWWGWEAWAAVGQLKTKQGSVNGKKWARREGPSICFISGGSKWCRPGQLKGAHNLGQTHHKESWDFSWNFRKETGWLSCRMSTWCCGGHLAT